MEYVRRVVIVGPGAAGKSVLATQLGAITGFPVIELDKCFWQPGLSPTPPDQWTAIQRELVEQQSWIMDGDLGPYDVTGVRFEAADTIVFLDFSRLRCACRAIRRSRERADFWRWLWGYRRQSRPLILQAIASHAGRAQVHVLSTPRAVREFVARADRSAPDQQLRLAVPARASRQKSASWRLYLFVHEDPGLTVRWFSGSLIAMPNHDIRITILGPSARRG